MLNYDFFSRFVTDFFGYLVFILSSYVIFGTDLSFRYFLIPVTFIAFFYTLSHRYSAAYEEGFESAEIFVSDMVQFVDDEDDEDVDD